MASIVQPDPKAQPLLRVIVEAIKGGRIVEGNRKTFLAYSEALELMGVPKRGRAGQQLQRKGLNELNVWTMRHPELPKIAALIVNKKTRRPSAGFPKSHGHGADDPAWERWWMSEANRAINYDWTPFLMPVERFRREGQEAIGLSVREDEKIKPVAFQEIIVIEPPPAHIRQSRITVSDILHWLAAGQSETTILHQHPELRSADIRASLAYAAERVAQGAPSVRKAARRPTFAEKWGGRLTLPPADPADVRLTHILEKYERLRE